MHQLIGHRTSAVWPITAKFIHHATSYAAGDPDVAVDDPYQIALCRVVCATHVADFRVGAKIVARVGGEVWVFVFDKDFGVMVGKVFEETAEGWVRGIMSG